MHFLIIPALSLLLFPTPSYASVNLSTVVFSLAEVLALAASLLGSIALIWCIYRLFDIARITQDWNAGAALYKKETGLDWWEDDALVDAYDREVAPRRRFFNFED